MSLVPGHPRAVLAAAVLLTVSLCPGRPSIFSAGLYQGGADARTGAMGGTGAAAADGPLGGLFENPAALGGIDRVQLQASGEAGVVLGSFHNRANRHADLQDAGGFGAVALVLPAGPLRIGLGVNPDIMQNAHWSYRDTPGGADGQTSYGVRRHESEILLLRTAVGVGWAITPSLSVGANVGLLYNNNELHAPYVFQSQPTLRTAKVRLDLQGDGFGWNGQFGLRWRPARGLTVSATYTTPARIEAEGDARGDAGVQFRNLGLGGARTDFAYRATVINHFPPQASLGATWEPRHGLTLSVQGDWLDWSNSFDTLNIHLRNGNNADLNALVGSNRLTDQVPLHWHDQYVGRLGVEQRLGAEWAVRAGYSFGNNPVPPGTLTPLTAAINEHTLSAGAGFHRGRWSIDAAYRWELPATGRVRQSDLAAGEYAQSTVGLSIQWFTLTTKWKF